MCQGTDPLPYFLRGTELRTVPMSLLSIGGSPASRLASIGPASRPVGGGQGARRSTGRPLKHQWGYQQLSNICSGSSFSAFSSLTMWLTTLAQQKIPAYLAGRTSKWITAWTGTSCWPRRKCWPPTSGTALPSSQRWPISLSWSCRHSQCTYLTRGMLQRPGTHAQQSRDRLQEDRYNLRKAIPISCWPKGSGTTKC